MYRTHIDHRRNPIPVVYYFTHIHTYIHNIIFLYFLHLCEIIILFDILHHTQRYEISDVEN